MYIALKWLIPPMSCQGNGDELPASVVELIILNSVMLGDCTNI
jgi:hypothetical protein